LIYDELGSPTNVLFLKEMVEELKFNNDWDMTIDLDRCIKVDSVRNKVKGDIDKITLKEANRKVLGEDAHELYVVIGGK